MTARAKRDLRARLRKSRKAISDSRRIQAQSAINRRLLSWPLGDSPATIGVYSSIGSEVCLADAVGTWLDEGHRIAWPLVREQGRLSFHISTPDELVTGTMGIAEPDKDLPAVEIESFDLLVVPGIGFTRFGARLGQGGGYYDRFLAGVGLRAKTLGLAFSVQIVPELPVEDTDVCVDAVVTEKGIASGGVWSL